MVTGIDKDDFDRRKDLRCEINEYGIGHRCRDRKVGGECLDAPTDDLFGGPRLEIIAEFGEFIVAELRCCQVGEAHVAHSDSPISAVYGPVSS